jgi:hypothetical protein
MASTNNIQASDELLHALWNGRIGALNTKCNSALDPIRRRHIDPRHVGELGNQCRTSFPVVSGDII